ncbi:MAG: carbamoyl-phosphate synthase large subunit, partial [Gordonibacter sp.]
MPKRDDIQTILVIGSGPIVIGQACEFDYSGAQACKVLKTCGYRVVLVNSNPATIMTDPGLADRTYVEPITVEFVEQVIALERPDALLPTLGGQTGLNTAVELARAGILEKYDVEMIGCDLDAIERGEDRKLFNDCMAELGIETARSGYAYSLADAEAIVGELGYPVVLRPSFTMGGAGGGIAHNAAELHEIVGQGLELSPAGEVLVEESIEGWKEYEMEVMRDHAGNGIIVCSIENFDPMGVHTGDSITVAPAQTLTDVEYQRMRAASLAILEKIGVETGGSNVQFSINPDNGRMIVIEMNPRVSRSSALASKATGFPIAKAAAKLAVGYTLDEIVNDITKATPACFEPSIDYCVVKVPRFAFEKFKGTDDTLSTRMKAVGEVMGIGRTFEESLGKAMRSLENGRGGLGADGKGEETHVDDAALEDMVARPTAERIFFVAEALRRGWGVERVFDLSRIDPFFLARMHDMVRVQENLRGLHLDELDADAFRLLKRYGLSDVQIAHLTGSDELTVRTCRKLLGVRPAFKTVDTCAAEFPSTTAYHYKTYDADETEVAPKTKKRAMILGAGPNRIGQGIEFDYCCVHASYALAEAGFETIMVNCNPETVSTDYDTSDKLYFEPLTFEDVMDIVDVERPDGVVVTLGGQTPLKLANALAAAGVPIMGTSPESIDLAEDRDRFSAILDELGITYPAAGMASTFEEACVVADQIGFPLLVRPSYVLGGRGMGIVYDGAQLEKYMVEAAKISPDHPVYLDRFLEGAVEVDLDALCDGEQVYVGGVLEHIEMAGIHSGDSACCTPPFALSEAVQANLRSIARQLALRLGVVGLINIQFAIKDQVIYIIEANPRASRTVPFVSKATGVPLAKLAARVMAGERIADLGLPPDDRRL